MPESTEYLKPNSTAGAIANDSVVITAARTMRLRERDLRNFYMSAMSSFTGA